MAIQKDSKQGNRFWKRAGFVALLLIVLVVAYLLLNALLGDVVGSLWGTVLKGALTPRQ